MSLRERDPADILMTAGFVITLAGGFVATVNHQSEAYNIGVAVAKSLVLAVFATTGLVALLLVMPVSTSKKEAEET